MPTVRYEDHTDTISRKLALLEAACSAGRQDLAMSLAASLKESLAFERDTSAVTEKPQIAAGQFLPVGQLPQPWVNWAQGWSHGAPFKLSETVGIARDSEPVDLSVALSADACADPARELRVARWDANENRLREIPSQLYDVRRQASERHARLVFLADVAAHDSAHYLIFCENPLAELPNYPTDLRVEGEGYGLDIANRHYLARLSRQMGQIERITFAREHGLELYAGGKGHGEPPDTDWGHDYVDQDNFQKLRLRNWPACPNFEVVRGPLCVQVRRWGFPFSPMHPLFAPSRVHMDVTYTFFARQPYFLKHSRFDVVQDCTIEAMRDDEWVFSGYSFTDPLWIDAMGRLHEGDVPAEQINSLWGVGFMNRTSRDAFIALRLEHAAEGFGDLPHGGTPTMHYAGHGQLWSRYPSGHARLAAGSSVRQQNAYLLSPYPEQDAAQHIQQVRHRLLNPLVISAETPPKDAVSALANPRILARPGEKSETAKLKPAIWEALRQVRDEQFYTVDANVVDMGYVYDISERDGLVRILLTMPHRGRPVYQFFVTQGGGRVSEGIRERVLKVPGVRDVVVDFTWYPAWTSARLTDQGRAALGLPT